MTRKKVMVEIAKHGGTLEINEDSSRCFDANADSPAGMVWWATGTHALVIHTIRGGKGWMGEMWASVFEDIKGGTVPCVDKECEYCNP